MTEFAHLHLASGFSMRYGTAMPEALVERAAQYGQPAVALTDRDGLYGAVRFVQAAAKAGLDAVLGVDLAMARGILDAPPDPRARRPRTPVRGGAIVDPRLPRITVLASGIGGVHGPHTGISYAEGWAALCRLVTDTHLRGERGNPIGTPEQVASFADSETGGRSGPEARGTARNPARLVVLLGPDSDVGRAVLRKDLAGAEALLRAWGAILPRDGLVVEIVCHGGPDGTPGSRNHAARMLNLADRCGIPAILAAAVRHIDPVDARIVDVLDAARRLVMLDRRHLDRVSEAGHLATTETMHRIAREVAERAGADPSRAGRLLADTLALAHRCAQHPRHDLGIGAVHLPEPHILGIPEGTDPQRVLDERCHAAILTRYPGASESERRAVEARLREELDIVAALGYPTYFMTVATVVDLIREMGVRVAARGSGAGSLVNYLLGISGVDPIRYDLLMERFCSPLRAELPDIDIDVESARRTDIYEQILDRFGGERVTCVSMMDTYKVRHAIRDVGSVLGMPPAEIDEIAKAFPHIRARDARQAIADLPELRQRGLDSDQLTTLFDLVEGLDGLPRHIALHPCGVILSNGTLLDRTPVEASWLGFPMSQFDKDDVEVLGLLKLDVLGIRMQSSMAYAVREIERTTGEFVDLDDRAQVPLDDEKTFAMIRTTHTLGCFQIESPGQRELIGKFGPVRFEDLIIDISLFRPGPVKSDMIRPFLEARHGWADAEFLHPTLIPALQETEGVVVFHEQMLRIISETTGVSLAQADEVRRAMGSPHGIEEIEQWWRPAAKARGYKQEHRDRIWAVLKAFASFGFCKAHAAAFALPTYQSAWLKTHHPAHFLAGVLTHDPGMYPKRLILDDARVHGVAVLGLDVNASGDTYRVERLDPAESAPRIAPLGDIWHPPPAPDPDMADGTGWGIRLSLSDVSGISEAEVARIVAGQPYASLADFWHRAQVSRPILEKLVLAGGFDTMYAMGATAGGLGRHGRMTRRDLLLGVAELDRWDRGIRTGRRRVRPARMITEGVAALSPNTRGLSSGVDPRDLAAAQSQAAAPVRAEPVQLALDLGDEPQLSAGAGLPDMAAPERIRAELDILGLDATGHVMDFYAPMLRALGVTPSSGVVGMRSNSTILVAGVKVATQTPPVRSGRRVVFLTLEDGTGPSDSTFFEDVQGPFSTVVFHSWLLLVRGITRRTGAKGISLRANGAWELSALWEAWQSGGLDAVHALLAATDIPLDERGNPVTGERTGVAESGGKRRVLVHASGFQQSPYADTRPPGEAITSRKLWHASPGSSGW
ncbi:putative DNA polymerase III alpha subunit [Nostocoides australiense Ben110]|uniref:DNA-directed DNA polymerase n=1 Tax=Nostocoides australiense Ben110 TaxID=1193182 RepID=W6JSY4_9MICO|nr:DNA polymerase III subunit alpha [Tetrasphaera australiensis]MCB1300206.1 DNA polymerase III subunit alpha [Tetrasphaera sp.]CCH72323.1 putative DNA polymerase III alpha subunit [Tetrasphaera australiensis Ben110]